jgi:hypothetical protein
VWVALVLAAGLVAVGGPAAGSTAGRAAGEYDGSLAIDYAGTFRETAVLRDAQGAQVASGFLGYTWHLTETVAVYGFDTGAVRSVVTSGPALTLSGEVHEIWAPPNQVKSCDGVLSPRRGARLSLLVTAPIPNGAGAKRVQLAVLSPVNGDYAQSSGSGDCRTEASTPGHGPSGPGLAFGDIPPQVVAALQDGASISVPDVGVAPGSSPFLHPINASGSSGTTQATFSALLSVKPVGMSSNQSLRIIRLDGGRKDVTGSTIEVPIGARLTVRAELSDGSAPRTPIRWRGVSSPEVVAGYVVAPEQAKVKPFSDSALRRQQLAFNWIARGKYVLTVRARDRTGRVRTAKVTFVVRVPSTSLVARTCRTDIGAFANGTFRLSLGDNRACGVNEPGIVFRAAVQSSGLFAGSRSGLNQLIRALIETNRGTCRINEVAQGKKPRPVAQDGGSTALDAFVFVTETQGPPDPVPDPRVGPNEEDFDVGAWSVLDTPGQGLESGRSWLHADERFADTLMYRPAGEGSIWIGLRKLGWPFAGRADRTGDTWRLSKQPPAMPAKNLTIDSAPAIVLPTWSVLRPTASTRTGC